MGSQVSVPPKGSQAAPAGNSVISFVPMLVVIGILYFLIIRPQQKQAKEHRRMMENLKAGDKVLTQGGILGTVTSVRSGIVQIKIADNVRVDVTQSAISKVLHEPSSPTSTTHV